MWFRVMDERDNPGVFPQSFQNLLLDSDRSLVLLLQGLAVWKPSTNLHRRLEYLSWSNTKEVRGRAVVW